MPSSFVRAATSMSLGHVVARNDERMVATGLERFGDAVEHTLPSCTTVDVFPCIGMFARQTVPPYTMPIA